MPEKFVIEPLLDQQDRLGWQGVLWRCRCPLCGWTGEPCRHPIDAGFQTHNHKRCPCESEP